MGSAELAARMPRKLVRRTRRYLHFHEHVADPSSFYFFFLLLKQRTTPRARPLIRLNPRVKKVLSKQTWVQPEGYVAPCHRFELVLVPLRP